MASQLASLNSFVHNKLYLEFEGDYINKINIKISNT